MPPSTMSSAPVMKPACSDSSHATLAAMSSGLPTRPTGCWTWSALLSFSPPNVDPAGRNTIDARVGPEADGERVRERHQAALSGGVGVSVRLRHVRARGRNQHHRAPGCAQRILRVFGEQEGGGEIGGDYLVPVAELGLAQAREAAHPRVRHESIEPAVHAQRSVDQRCDVGFLAHIGHGAGRADLGCDGRRRGGGLIRHHHLPALPREPARGGSTNAVAGAGNDDDALLVLAAHAMLLSLASLAFFRFPSTASRTRRYSGAAINSLRACRAPAAAL